MASASIDQNKVLSYIEKRRNGDGGYNFARVEPSGGQDTYFAALVYDLFGLTPPDKGRVVDFMDKLYLDNVFQGPVGIYRYAKTLKTLGGELESREILDKINRFKNKQGGYGLGREVYIEIYSELEATFYAVQTILLLGGLPDKDELKNYTLSYRNSDGGFGSNGFSTIPTTYYALSTLLSIEEADEARQSIDYLRQKESAKSSHFIENVYWTVESLTELNEGISRKDKIIEFVKNCQRDDNFGFRRSPNGGISTFEYTYCAIKILRDLDK